MEPAERPSDRPAEWPVVASGRVFEGAVVDLRRDTLAGRSGEDFEREVVVHPGAVAIVAVDDEDRVLVVRQYRHPAGEEMVELPAGLLDVPEEPHLAAAQRELQEEGHVTAESWSELVTLLPSPGISTEAITVFAAEGISHDQQPADFVARHEEAGMTRAWLPLEELVEAILHGEVKNGTLIAGSLALWAKRHGTAR